MVLESREPSTPKQKNQSVEMALCEVVFGMALQASQGRRLGANKRRKFTIRPDYNSYLRFARREQTKATSASERGFAFTGEFRQVTRRVTLFGAPVNRCSATSRVLGRSYAPSHLPQNLAQET